MLALVYGLEEKTQRCFVSGGGIHVDMTMWADTAVDDRRASVKRAVTRVDVMKPSGE